MCISIIASTQSADKGQTPNFTATAAALGLPHLHQRADGSWAVPSGSRPGMEHTVWMTWPASPTCSCEGFQARGRCYHLALVRAAMPAPVIAPFAPYVRRERARGAYLDETPAQVRARGAAAFDDLFGPQTNQCSTARRARIE